MFNRDCIQEIGEAQNPQTLKECTSYGNVDENNMMKTKRWATSSPSYKRKKMSEYKIIEKPFLDQLEALGWQVIDQGEGIPQDWSKSPREVG